jgi:hypothetical protein
MDVLRALGNESASLQPCRPSPGGGRLGVFDAERVTWPPETPYESDHRLPIPARPVAELSNDLDLFLNTGVLAVPLRAKSGEVERVVVWFPKDDTRCVLTLERKNRDPVALLRDACESLALGSCRP